MSRYKSRVQDGGRGREKENERDEKGRIRKFIKESEHSLVSIAVGVEGVIVVTTRLTRGRRRGLLQ